MERRNLKTSDLLFRSWYYFRLGYGTYLTFPIGYVSTLVTIYYLAIQNVPGLKEVFSRFVLFGIIATIAIFPLSVATGWVHAKRSRALKSEFEIAAEANPYNYKLPPGINLEVVYPFFEETLAAVKDLLDKQGLLDPKRAKRFEELLQKIDLLLKGGYMGRPRTKIPADEHY
jgi:hypothetical protein